MKLKTAILRGITLFTFFLCTASIVTVIKDNLWYLLLFGSMGLFAGWTEFIIAIKPEKAQIIRRVVLTSLGTMLASLAIIIAINFQFSEVCFNIYTGIITGAIIQFIVARIFVPLLFGNIFCSRACWDSAIFEITDGKHKRAESSSKISAWIFIAIIAVTTYLISQSFVPTAGTQTMRYIFISENIFIIFTGLALSHFFGRRFYCRKLCPFIAVSSIFAKFAIFKITPIQNEKCTSCGLCTRRCPMGIDVMKYVRENRRVDHPNCIMCEKCVTACPQSCLIMMPKGLENK